MIALIKFARAGLFNRNNILSNILAGIVVGIVTIPLSMAFAIGSNVKPEVGLYTSIIAAFCVSAFGGTRTQISGPTGAFIGLLLATSSRFGQDGLQIATTLAGIILIIMGLLHCGKMIRFIPEQVIVGFTIGISINLLIGQFPNFCGLACGRLSINFTEKIAQICHALPTIDLTTTILALLSLVILIFNKYTIFRSIPAPVVALFCGIVTQSIFKFPSIATIGSAFGGIPQTLPSLQIPQNITFERIYLLLPSALAIAMLCAIESLLAALITDRLTGQKHSSNQELIGHGIANAICPLFGGIASAGSIARTAASMRAGGNSPLAGIVSSFVLIGIVCFFAPLANNAPLATLSAIIFMVAFNMLRPRSVIALIRRSPKLDILTLLITCALTLVYGIVFAVNVGVVLSALVLMYRLSISTDIRNESTHSMSNVEVYGITGPFFFGILDKFEQMLDQMQPNTRALVLNFANVPFIDTAGLQALSTFVKELKNKNKQVFFVETSPQILQKLKRAKILENDAKYLQLSEALDIANSNNFGKIVDV